MSLESIVRLLLKEIDQHLDDLDPTTDADGSAIDVKALNEEISRKWKTFAAAYKPHGKYPQFPKIF